MRYANGKYISVNWNASGGGAFAVIPVDEVGKAPDKVPLFRGHTATVLDTDFNPFNDNIIISGSDDSKVGLWRIPDDYSFHNYVDSNGDIKDIAPVAMYTGHKRKVGHVKFHPTAENVAATSSLDYTVKLWDVENGKDKITLTHKDLVTSFAFNYNGNLLATTSRDRKLRVWDIRANEIVSEGPGHTGAKASRVAWMGNSDRIGTTGFSKLSDRQMGVWDATNIEAGPIGGFYSIDSSAGILIPFFDESNQIFYVGGKGDGNIRYYEFQDDELFPLSEYQSIEPQRGLAIAPKRTVKTSENEVLRVYKTTKDSMIEPISFIVPRKAEVFQDDIYPDAPSSKPALSAEEWFAGKSVDGPILVSMEDLYNGDEPSLRPSTVASTPAKTESESPKKAELASPKKATPATPKKEKTPDSEPAIKEADAVSAGFTAPKTKVDDLLQKDEVNSLLKKAATLDSEKETVKAADSDADDAAWDEEPTREITPAPKEDVKPEPKKAETPKVETPKVETPKVETPKVETPKVETPKVETPKVETPKVETPKVGTPKVETPKKEEPAPKVAETPKEAPADSASGSKPLTLKGSIEKLSSVVEHFEAVVAKLEAANLEKDERLKALEAKVSELLEKN
ncbi:CYFA0S18e00650g1_1 [Cyberlindnera fabianii]|uniref:Coronin n=1 Tax=Cyberlindnera fabianii TaxID=36022 RepID=A0A061B7M2_CYBFA|nr:CYFA0S18e00650g1_1 [Cyberlindnera fabianii]